MNKAQLFAISDEELEQRRIEAEGMMIAARNEMAECELHQTWRRQIRERNLRQQISELQDQLQLLKSG